LEAVSSPIQVLGSQFLIDLSFRGSLFLIVSTGKKHRFTPSFRVFQRRMELVRMVLSSFRVLQKRMEFFRTNLNGFQVI
jgi:hypothetical protein